MHPPGIEPGPHTWQACIIPLDYGCLCVHIGRVVGVVYIKVNARGVSLSLFD